MGQGYIKLYRQIQDCWIWFDEEHPEKFSKGQAWIDLLLLANHKEKKIRFDDGFRIIERGQFLTSKRKLAERWMWNRRTVDKFLSLLAKDETITIECTTKNTIITIVNYSIFQNTDAKSEPQNTPQDAPHNTPQDAPRCTPQSSTNNKCNNDKECKNVNNIYSVHFEEFWKCYPRRKEKAKAYKCYQTRLKDGFTEEELLRACKAYADECKKKHTEEHYIKLCATFIGPNTPFVDYLKGGDTDGRDSDTDSSKTQTGEGIYDDFAKDYFAKRGITV